MSTNDHPDQETERTQLRVRHRELQPQVGRRGDLPATASGDVVSPAFTPIRNTTFRTTSVNRPETSSSPWHDVSTNVAYGRPHGCTATGLAASPAMGEGTTRDHFGREAAAVITSAKGETEAATRPTARARRRLPALRQALSAGLEQLTSWCERERNRIEWVRQTPVHCAVCVCAATHSTTRTSRRSGICCPTTHAGAPPTTNHYWSATRVQQPCPGRPSWSDHAVNEECEFFSSRSLSFRG
jgi:hypothetical protein